MTKLRVCITNFQSANVAETEGKSATLDKLVEKAATATDDPEAQQFISRGHKVLKDLAESEEGRNMIHQVLCSL